MSGDITGDVVSFDSEPDGIKASTSSVGGGTVPTPLVPLRHLDVVSLWAGNGDNGAVCVF